MTFDQVLSDERARRLKSLSDIRALYHGAYGTVKDAGAQAIIVLCYAHWEGFFNFCVDQYVECVNSLGRAIIDINPALLACEIGPHIISLRDRNFRVELRPEFARKVCELMSCKLVSQSVSILKAASNLDFDRLRTCLNALDIPEDSFLPHRNFITYELTGWRHQVAHGGEPALGSADLIAHSHRTEDLLLIVKESFEDRIHVF
jgi:hypothetical protein